MLTYRFSFAATSIKADKAMRNDITTDLVVSSAGSDSDHSSCSRPSSVFPNSDHSSHSSSSTVFSDSNYSTQASDHGSYDLGSSSVNKDTICSRRRHGICIPDEKNNLFKFVGI
jgi:hypothetical protein